MHNQEEALRRQAADAARARGVSVTPKPEQVIQDAELMSNVMDIFLDNPTLNEQLSARLMREEP
jgi:hypothetical protein